VIKVTPNVSSAYVGTQCSKLNFCYTNCISRSIASIQNPDQVPDPTITEAPYLCSARLFNTFANLLVYFGPMCSVVFDPLCRY
jgi:hypothetical protein